LLPAELDNWLKDNNRRPLVMGVLNVTPDSFSDGGKFVSVSAATEHALAMLEAGADWIDIGGESTRPGAEPVAAAEQIRRVGPVIAAIRKQSAAVLSMDTRLWAVAEAAIGAGANLVNDISAGLQDAEMLGRVAAAGVPIVLMHMRETPQTMQNSPSYGDVTAEVRDFLWKRLAGAQEAGILPHRILLDPGIGFGKTAEHSLTLLRNLGQLAAMGRPLVVGTSRKSFIGKVLDEPNPLRRTAGDAAAISWSLANGAAVVRVHEVGPAAQMARMVRAIQGR
jgi:dihydropteroate synthase